jgi:hypothetical protein
MQFGLVPAEAELAATKAAPCSCRPFRRIAILIKLTQKNF